jgi:hypothetical protein
MPFNLDERGVRREGRLARSGVGKESAVLIPISTKLGRLSRLLEETGKKRQ